MRRRNADDGPDARLRDLLRRIAAGDLGLLRLASELYDESGGRAKLPDDLERSVIDKLDAIDELKDGAVAEWMRDGGGDVLHQERGTEAGYLDAMANILRVTRRGLVEAVGYERETTAADTTGQRRAENLDDLEEIARRVRALGLRSVGSVELEHPGFIYVEAARDYRGRRDPNVQMVPGPVFAIGDIDGPWTADEYITRGDYLSGRQPDRNETIAPGGATIAQVVDGIERILRGRIGG